MTKKERGTLLWIWLFLGLVPLFMRPLWEPDEARYAEIPREMLASADWLTPRLNQVLYFEKPPLQYWLSALSMKAFGLHAFAARLPLALATLITLWCAWKLATRLGARQATWAAFMAATAVLAYVCAQVLTLDALFSAFQVLALVAGIEAVAARFEERPATGWSLLAFGSMALAMLTKGLAAPVLVGGILICSLPFAWSAPRMRSALLRTLLDPLGWLLFAAVAAPWFVLVERANPGHANFFFIHEHFARYTSHVHDRAGSKNPVLDKFYFTAFLAVGVLPWLGACVTGLRRGVAFLRRTSGPVSEGAPLIRWTVATVILGAAVPLLFYSLSGSKLPPYIHPAIVPLLALACALEKEGEEWTALARAGRELLVLGVLFLAAPFIVKDLTGPAWILALGVAFLAMGCWGLRPRALTGPRFMAGLGAALLLLTFAASRVAPPTKDASSLIRKAPAGAQWISCGDYYQVLPFLTGERVVVVAGTGELAYGRDHLDPGTRARWFQEDLDQLLPMAQRLRAEDPSRPVAALIDRWAWRDLPEDQKAAFQVTVRTDKNLLAVLR
ncbi:glycosyltransferase family 39 protein [Geothrix sp. 21YS21S-2]|uniref:glycosyltransferase family 39 protein n=1 Tax=Geothrix sp. 21YS21S-2 TaxID=3068893 RepID=UPI0027BAE6F6|nr:glycosyltransferase family 39 protein [Geothrix sp. 21YS21S-2]